MRFGKFVSFIFLAFYLGGCAHGPRDYRDKEPDKIFVSEKGSRDIAVCISDGFDDSVIRHNTNLKPTMQGYTVQVWTDRAFLLILPAREDNVLLADVIDQESGSEVRLYYSLPYWFPLVNGPEKKVKDCL